ncbi:uncharacterized protein [Linepithema humile]|uniref:uncharacterized protein n=1 Tax=Linepithema humile TaxID=83485 RepID=UPI00351EBEB7
MSERREGHGFPYWLGGNPSQNNPSLQPNQSWLLSDQGRRAINTLSNPERETRETPREFVVNDRDESVANVDENVETTREYSFRELDNSLISGVSEDSRQDRPTPTRPLSRISERTETASTTYDSSIFDPRELNNEITMAQPPNDVTARIEDGEPPRRQINIDGNVTNATSDIQENLIETQIGVLADAINEMRAQTQVLQEHLHQQILNLHERFNAQIYDIQGQQQGSTSNRELNNASRGAMNAPEVNVSYGQGPADVRNRPTHSNNYMQLKEARSLIPEIDGTTPNRIQEFLSASTYAMESIDPTEELQLLKAILCTKLKGKILLDFQTRNIQSFAQLKQEIERGYTTHKSVTHLQLEFNTLKQKQGESAQNFGSRVDQLAMKLYESMIEGKTHTIMEKNTIKNTVQNLALQNFQIGLQDNIKTIVRVRNYGTLQEAIAVATAEEKLQGPSPALNKYNAYYKTTNKARKKTPQCAKCGKWGHIGRECRTSRFANRFSLPKADGHKVNALEKYCKYCKKPGHFQEECWQLNGRPEKGNAKENAQHKTVKENKAKKADNDEEDDAANKKKTRPIKALLAHTDKTAKIHANLDLIALPIVEAKNEHATMLVDTGATP